MKQASGPIPANEEQRLKDLYDLNILDSEPDQDFTDIVELASYITNTPMTLISLIDRHRQWFKARKGIKDPQMDREIAMCAHAIMHNEPLIVPDASNDERFAGFSTVTGVPHVRFYAGFPLITNSGSAIGTLCVIDTLPRDMDKQQEKALNTLARQVVKLMTERANSMKHKEQAWLEKQQNTALERLMQTQRRILTILGHDARAPLYAINQMLKLTAKGKFDPEQLQSNIEMITNQLGATLIMIEDLLSWGKAHLKPQQENGKAGVSVRETVEEVIAVLQGNAQLKGIALYNNADPAVLSIFPMTMISFIVRNLLNNAIKFTDDGSVTVEVVCKQQEIILTVADTGKGMPGYRVDHLNREHIEPGDDGLLHDTGIGIMMIKEFLAQMGGSIWFESKEDKGTKVMVTLPNQPGQLRVVPPAAEKFVM